MNWVFREATIAPATRGEAARVQEYAELVDSTGAVVYSVNKPYGEDVTAEVNAAQCVTDDTVAVKKASVTLTDAQIKALPTTAVQLIAPTHTGIGYSGLPTSLPNPIQAWAVLDARGGAYGNLQSVFSLKLKHGSAGDDTISNSTYAKSEFESVGVFRIPIFVPSVSAPAEGLTGFLNPSRYFLSDNFDDNALIVSASNAAGGDLTGGHASNSMEITVLYTDTYINLS
jgi:hypothetical protein